MRKLFAVLTLIFCGYMGLYTVAAQGATTGFSTTACSDEEKSSIIDTINLEVFSEEYLVSGIQCFDVREDGVYALAFGEGSNSRISVYDSDGSFQYGYKFNANGDFAVEFYEEAVAIYFSRGDILAVYDSMGVCQEIRKVSNTKQNHIYAKEILDRVHKRISDKEYNLERDFEIGDSYSRFVILNEHKERQVMFDVSTEHRIEQLMLLIAPVCFFAFVIRGIWKKHGR